MELTEAVKDLLMQTSKALKHVDLNFVFSVLTLPAQVVRDTACSLLEALAGVRPLCSVLQSIQRRMHSGCQMNKRRKYPNSAQLLQRGSTN